MIDINEDELHTLIGRLDERIGKEGAIVRLADDGAEGSVVIVANHLGYLRLGVEFLKAAYLPLEPDSDTADVINVDLPYLFGQRTICWEFRRREEGLPLPEGAVGGAASAVAGGVGCLFALFILASLVTGMPIVSGAVFTFLAWLFHIPF